jgi:hypothetical protein
MGKGMPKMIINCVTLFMDDSKLEHNTTLRPIKFYNNIILQALATEK